MQSPGDTVKVKGPQGHVRYEGRGRLRLHGQLYPATHVSLIAGGSGITPAFQLIRAVCTDAGDPTRIRLVYANHSTDDILLRGELDALAAAHPRRFQVWYIVSERPGGDWRYSIGHVDRACMQSHLFPRWDPERAATVADADAGSSGTTDGAAAAAATAAAGGREAGDDSKGSAPEGGRRAGEGVHESRGMAREGSEGAKEEGARDEGNEEEANDVEGEGGTFALVCGPPGMIENACIPVLEALGYENDALIEF
jgi:NAD(P)H-flavin reductase